MRTTPLELEISVPAVLDLDEILLYTSLEWGADQAHQYIDDLRAALRLLTKFPDLGRRRNELGSETRSFPISQHIVLYRCSDSILFVQRVVHEREDIKTALIEVNDG